MKRKRNLIIMAVVLLALCVIIVVENLVTEHVDSINTTDEIILSVDVGEVTAVSWTYDDESLNFTNTDGTWYDSDDTDFPVLQSEIEEFLGYFEEVHATFIIDDVSNYSQYGLDEPECTVTITDADSDITISMGDYSTMDEQRYISIGDGKVYLIADDLLEYVVTDRDEFMQQDELPSVDTVESLTISGEEDLNIVYDEDGEYLYTDDYDYYLVADEEYLALDSGEVKDCISELSYITLTDYVTYTASSDDLSEYGLDSPACTVEVTGTTEVENEDGETETETVSYVLYMGIVYDDSEDSDDSDDTDEDEEASYTVYIRLDDSEIIYTMEEDRYETFANATYDSLRPDEVLSLDWDDVTGMTISFDGDTYDFEVMLSSEYEGTDVSDSDDADTDDETSDEDDELVYLLDGEEVEFDEIMSAVNSLKYNSFSDEESDDDAELSFTVYLENDNYPSVSVDIYQYDGNSSIVAVDGETVGYIDRSDMVDLREAVTSIVLGSAE